MNQDCQSIVESVINKYHSKSDHLIQILIDIQAQLTYISNETKALVAKSLNIEENHISSVVEFYSLLYNKPVGQYRLLFANNITDQMLGNQALANQLTKRLKIQSNKLSKDGTVSVDFTSCTGLCDQGPALLVNNLAIPKLTSELVDKIADNIENKIPLEKWDQSWFSIEDNIQKKDHLLSSDFKLGDALKSAIKIGRDNFLANVKTSKLRGRGGAGFLASIKQASCIETGDGKKVVICNADEGEPGTFKDRVLLTSYPERVVEGMLLVAYTIKASIGFIYLRGEYTHLRKPLLNLLEQMRKDNLLGKSILGVNDFNFDIEIHMGAGAYICGEETALIESLEGKPGKPRIRPPFPVTCGYQNLPTVVNNVETLSLLTLIAINGGDWFKKIGYRNSTGTKILSISGDCETPGIYEYQFGVTIQQILEDCGAKNTIAIQVGGPSGICLAPHEFSRRLAFEDVPSAGAFMVFNNTRHILDVVRNFSGFFAHESCGFCTPCRVGTTLVKNIIEKIYKGSGTKYELSELERIGNVMNEASHCGLGQTAGRVINDTLIKFRPSYERRLATTDFIPSFNLDASLAKSRSFAGREDEPVLDNTF